jgi:hypothetical protein
MPRSNPQTANKNMKYQKSLLVAALAAPALLAFVAPADKVAFAPSEGASLTKTFTTSGTFQLDDLSVNVGGMDQAPDMEMTISWAQNVAVTDTYESTKDGAPVKLRRTYDELGQELEVDVVVDMSAMGGDTQEDGASGSGSSDLEGKTVNFVWDEDDGSYKKSYHDEEGDEDLLEGILEDMDLRALLPSEEVSEGDEWEIDLAGLTSILAPGGDLKIELEMDGEEMEGPDPSDLADINELMKDLLDGEATGKYVGQREVDGTKYGVCEINIEIDTAKDMTDMLEEMMGEQMPEGMDVSFDRMDLELTLESKGELLWDLRGGHVHAFSIEGDMTIVLDMGMSMDMGGQEMTMEMSMEMSGTLGQEVSVE